MKHEIKVRREKLMTYTLVVQHENYHYEGEHYSSRGVEDANLPLDWIFHDIEVCATIWHADCRNYLHFDPETRTFTFIAIYV